ncbi:hypothetical protein [Streptomyces parvulus]|uniref:hypothetical protein n=1 Tax=Streptomyces parvulus TaxID=146923 RepID=UPI00367C413D
MRPADQTEYIVQCIRDAGSMYEDDARAFLAEHDAHVLAEALAQDAPSPEFNAAVARRAQLLAEITARGGEWTTRRTHNLYKSLGITGVFRSTVREDLAAVHRAGHLVQHDEPGRRFYTARGGADRG